MNGDPYWTEARFNSADANGNKVAKGDRIFYYPRTKTVLSGTHAEQAAAEFADAAADEAFMSGESY